MFPQIRAADERWSNTSSNCLATSGVPSGLVPVISRFLQRKGVWKLHPVKSRPYGWAPRAECIAVVTGARAPVSFRALVVLSLLLLAAHAPASLNDGMFMDSWLVLKAGQEHVPDLEFLWHGAGHPVFYLYYSAANLTSVPIVMMQMMALVAVLFGAISLSLAAARAGLLGPMEALGFSLMVWTYPGFQVWADKGLAVYLFSFGLFCFGTWLLMLAFDAKGARHAVLRIAAALVFFLSFALNSLMMLYVFVMVGLFVAIWRANSGGPIRRLVLSAWHCAARYPEFVVLPLVYWGALNIWFKRIGAYAGYYGIHLPGLSELRSGWNAFFQMGCMNVLARAGQTARPTGCCSR
jgi:hypothetical protein